MNKISIYVLVALLVAIIGYFAFERSNASKLTGTQTSQHWELDQRKTAG
jgi:uncharacterized membrane protein YkvI